MASTGIVDEFRDQPIDMTIILGSVLTCLLLFAYTFVLLLSGLPTGRGDPWLALIGVGVVFVLFWTALLPLYEWIS